MWMYDTSIAADVEHPTQLRTISKLLALLEHRQNEALTCPTDTSPAVQRILPMKQNQWWTWGSHTLVMGILNVTSDSFSNDGHHHLLSVDAAVTTAQRMVQSGVHVIDIGGQSTRPGAPMIETEEECKRIEPIIRAIRSAGISIPISIDTFRAKVAEIALNAGATMVNDVTGGRGDTRMLPLIAKNRVPYITMHMRGTSLTMNEKAIYGNDNGYANGHHDVITSVAQELHARIVAALSAGIPRWMIIVDPGIGFAKVGHDNFTIVSHLPQLMAMTCSSTTNSFPLLVGPSRKRFIGEVTGKINPEQRQWGTAATVTACVAGGADIVRVHDVEGMRDVVLVADCIWRQGPKARLTI